MRNGFTIIELVVIVVILGILSTIGVMFIPDTKLQQAADTLISNLKYTKVLAQTDDRYYTINDGSITNNVNLANQMKDWKKGMWQLQFHLSGNNAKGSYSIYADTGRNAATTNFDSRPMDGDLIAKDPINMSCLSGYSDNNLPAECLNNISSEVKLYETFNITRLEISIDQACLERDTARIYFDSRGLTYCGKNPTRMQTPAKVVLYKNNKTATICISTNGLIYGSNNGNCDL